MQIHEAFHIFLKRKLALPISYLQNKNKNLDVKYNVSGVGKMAQQLRTFDTFPEDPGSTPRTYMGLTIVCVPVPGVPNTLSGF